VPQIIAALLGGVILTLVGGHQYSMMVVAGISLFVGALCVGRIKK
jgi:maltose/moltooligosaccharide transporter